MTVEIVSLSCIVLSYYIYSLRKAVKRMQEFTYTVSYWDSRNTRHIVSGLTNHQKESLLFGLKQEWHLPFIGKVWVEQSSIVVDKVYGKEKK